jgi:dimethylhistidine N-methyltransferase
MNTAIDTDAPLNLQNSARRREIEEIVAGLSLSRKMISPKYFYDERGSRLFERICELPEYYLTRTEIAIMRESIGKMVEAIGPQASVIEFGSGAGLKTRILLDNLVEPVAYVPVDISMEHLRETAVALTKDFPGIEILPVAADFTHPFPLPQPATMPKRNLVYFPGSTIGNFEPEAALGLLRVMHQEAGAGGALLIGLDLRKDRRMIESAYNDEEGVTAEFNLNLLRRLNRDYGSDFELEAFRHTAVYRESSGRIEMCLVSQRDQEVTLGGHRFSFTEGEKIITEYCHKFSLEGFREQASRAGFRHAETWIDANRWFSIQLYER